MESEEDRDDRALGPSLLLRVAMLPLGHDARVLEQSRFDLLLPEITLDVQEELDAVASCEEERVAVAAANDGKTGG
ncbi:MAG TPA: hypothetical protein VFF73_06920 [Planctomycetota bacterium]|nr:hypothetical protein [Planctomycetota bacterium]